MRHRSSLLRLLVGVSGAALLLFLFGRNLPKLTTQQLNTRVAPDTIQNEPHERYIGREVLGRVNISIVRGVNSTVTPSQPVDKKKMKPQIRAMVAKKERVARMRLEHKNHQYIEVDKQGPCYDMRSQDRRPFLENMLNKEEQMNLNHSNTSQDDYFINPYHNSYLPLMHEDIDSVEAFVFFAGWQRSGHSIIGSLLDGHPDVVIAHEFFLFTHLHQLSDRRASITYRTRLYNQLAANSFRQANFGDRSNLQNKKGYNLKLSLSWQGCYRRLRVIGDKCAGDVTNYYRWNTQTFPAHIYRLKSIVGVPLKVIKVIRNPYDMIATLSLYRGSPINDVKVEASAENKYDNQEIIQSAADTIIDKAYYLHLMEQEDYDWEMIRVYSEDFIRNPKEIMGTICRFLTLDCTEDYLQQCADKTFKSVSKSREVIVWDPAVKTLVENAIRDIPFFNRYSFDSD